VQDAKEEIRARLPIEDVVSQYIELKRAGRTLKGRSPWGVDKTPSFMVSPEKGIWHDFSANKGGDIFSFIMEVEGISFREALEKLAAQAGVELKKYDRSDEVNARLKMRAKEALELACKYFQVCLAKNKAVCEYVFYKRELNRPTIVDFRVGYAPNSKNSLVQFLEKRGYSLAELKEAGLVNRFDGDLFKGRMMIPFVDANSGDVIGFTGRIIDKGEPKYLNTPQTLLFDKSRHIFGLYQAKEAIRKSDAAVIVEGNLDVVSSHQAGVKNVVATAGTAMTLQHLKALSRLAGRIRVAFDGDRAGVSATERAINLAQEIGVELEVVSLPDDVKDPDELIQKDAALWKVAVERAQPAVDWVIARHAEMEDLATAEGKRRFSTTALRIVRGLKDPVEQEHYLAVISKKTGASITALKAKLAGERTVNQQLRKTKIDKEKPHPVQDETEDMLAGLAASEKTLRRWLAAISGEMLENDNARQLIGYLRENLDIDLSNIPQGLQKIEQYVKIVQLKSESRYANWEQKSLDEEMARLVRQITIKHRENQKNQLLTQLREAEAAGDEVLSQRLRQNLNQLIKEKM